MRLTAKAIARAGVGKKHSTSVPPGTLLMETLIAEGQGKAFTLSAETGSRNEHLAFFWWGT